MRQPQTPRGAIAGGGTPAQSPSLARYWSHGQFYDRYWSKLFGVTHADLELVAAKAREAGQARDLTSIVRDLVDSRLSNGPQLSSAPAPDSKTADPQVRLWDPQAAWEIGDRTIVVVPDLGRARAFAPRVGEIVQVGGDHVLVRVDGRSAPEVYALGAHAGSRSGPTAESRMASLAGSNDEGSRVDHVIWRFGTVIVSRVLGALKADARFVELEGLWFPRDLAKLPREEQLALVARTLFFGRTEPVTLDELIAMDAPGTGVPLSERFGWALAADARPDLFARIETLPHPRWVLSGPPPVQLVVRHAVYDPDSYLILCTPGETLSRPTAQRLWDTGLLRVALGSGDASPESVPSPGNDPTNAQDDHGEDPTTHKPDRSRVAWPRWLPFSRQ